MGIHWSTPAWLWPLLLILAVGAVFLALWAYDRTNPRPPGRLKGWLGILRSVVFVLLVLAIAGPVLSLLRSERVPARLMVLIEDSASMGLRDAGEIVEPGGAPSRWETALAWSAAVDSALESSGADVEMVFLRGNGLEPLREFRLDDPVIPAPTSHGTDLSRLMREAFEGIAGKSVKGVVVFSDGQETSGMGRASEMAVSPGNQPGPPPVDGQSSTDMLVVGVGDLEGSADRIIKDLRFPDTAYAGDEMVVEFSVDHRFAAEAAGSSFTARLSGSEGVVAETTVEVTGRVAPVSLSFKPEGAGLQVYRLEVSQLDNERFLDNNEALLPIDIRKERSRVLLLTGQAGWDARFLSQAAASEERIALEVVYRTVEGLAFADSLVPWAAPTDAAGWRAWDGVVLVDWSGALTGQNWVSLRDAVHAGLGLLVVSGEGGATPRGPAIAPALASLLPVETENWTWSAGPLFAEAVAASGGHPVLEGLAGVGNDPQGGGIAALPPLDKVLRTQVLGDGETLLEARRQGKTTGPETTPLLVTGQPQGGRVAWFGGRHLWELSFWNPGREYRGASSSADGGGDPAGRRLLRNLLVWTAAGEENSGLVFTGRQAFFQEGERIRLAAQWRDMRGRPVLDRKLSLQLRSADAGADTGQVRTFALSMTDRASGYAEVVLPPLPPGRYSIQLVGQGDTPVMGRRENLVVAGHSIEATQVRMDRRRLVQLAERHGGDFLAATGSESRERFLAGLGDVTWDGLEVPRRSRWDFWSGWPFLTLVASLLGLEWYLRRRNGLL